MTPPDPHDFAVRQSQDRVHTRFIVWTALLAIVIGVAAVIVSGALLARFGRGRDAGPPKAIDAPAQIGTIEQSLIIGSERGIDLRHAQSAAIDHYGWVDRDAGVVRIPIER